MANIWTSCAAVALLLCFTNAYPRPRPRPYPQQAAALPPHLLRQYLAEQQQRGAERDATPIFEDGTGQGPQPSYIQGNPGQAQQLRANAVQRLVQRTQQQQYQPQQQQLAYQSQQPLEYSRPRPQQARPLSQRPQNEEQGLPEDYDPNPSYQFGFDVNDDQNTNYQNRKEQREGNVIKGSYSVVDSDGFIRTVTYTADPKEGFKAEVTRQPTDIVVKIPTPQPQYQQEQQQPLRQRIPAVQSPQHLQQQQQHLQQQQAAPQYYRYQQ